MRRLLYLLLFLALPLQAQQELEILPLHHQTVDRVLPALQPLLEPGGTLSGMNGQLFLRATRKNREDIKRALAALDTPIRKLLIRISQNRTTDDSGRGGGASGQVVLGNTRRSDVEARVWDSRSARQESGNQMVQTIEGGRAFIQVGRTFPVALRQMVLGPGGAMMSETLVYRDIGRGFYAEPHLAGDRVTLEISQQADSPGTAGVAGASLQRLTTTVSGRLGEWIELGASGHQAAAQERGGISVSTGELRDSRSIWLLVEEIR